MNYKKDVYQRPDAEVFYYEAFSDLLQASSEGEDWEEIED